MAFLHTELVQDRATGGVWSADKDGLRTGFDVFFGVPWIYYHRLHVGATAWLVLAEQGVNPFWPTDPPMRRSAPP